MSNDPKLLDVTPASGWWVLIRVSDTRTTRTKVAAWGRFEDCFGDWSVVPLVAGDADHLDQVANLYSGGTWDLRLWHDGETYCGCGRAPHDPTDTDDVDWCETCAGVIRRPAT